MAWGDSGPQGKWEQEGLVPGCVEVRREPGSTLAQRIYKCPRHMSCCSGKVLPRASAQKRGRELLREAT